MCFQSVSKAVVDLSRFRFRAKLEGIASVCIHKEPLLLVPRKNCPGAEHSRPARRVFFRSPWLRLISLESFCRE